MKGDSSLLNELDRSEFLDGTFDNLTIFGATKVKFCLSPEVDCMIVNDAVDVDADDDTSAIVLAKFEGEVVIVLPLTFTSCNFFRVRSIAAMVWPLAT